MEWNTSEELMSKRSAAGDQVPSRSGSGQHLGSAGLRVQQQFLEKLRVHRLDQVPIEAAFQRPQPVVRLAVAGHGDQEDPRSQGLPQLAGYLVAVLARQPNIDQGRLGE